MPLAVDMLVNFAEMIEHIVGGLIVECVKWWIAKDLMQIKTVHFDVLGGIWAEDQDFSVRNSAWDTMAVVLKQDAMLMGSATPIYAGSFKLVVSWILSGFKLGVPIRRTLVLALEGWFDSRQGGTRFFGLWHAQTDKLCMSHGHMKGRMCTWFVHTQTLLHRMHARVEAYCACARALLEKTCIHSTKQSKKTNGRKKNRKIWNTFFIHDNILTKS